MRIMLTGAGGFLGSRLFTYYREKYEVWAPSHKELDFTRKESARKAVQDFHPDVLLHCGAISDVGACERDPELSMRVNVEGTGIFSEKGRKGEPGGISAPSQRGGALQSGSRLWEA